MPNRVTLVVLFEDEMHERFINAFLKRMNLPTVGRARLLKKQRKSDVFDAFPIEVQALRATDVRTQLMVVVDGDELSDDQIKGRLKRKLKEAGLKEEFSNDPILIVRPRWEMENWALYLLGSPIGEERDSNARKKVGDRGRVAGRVLADACKSGQLPAKPLPSIVTACDEWRAHRNRWDL